MNENANLQVLKKLWIAFAAYYQQPLTDDQILMYAEDCAEHRAETIGLAMKAWRKNPKHSRMPLPGQLLEFIAGGTTRGNATAIAANLIAAVKRHDYTWPLQLNKSAYRTGTFEGDFKAELGDEAWKVVNDNGGWVEFCESFWRSGNETAFKAQLRDHVEAIVSRAQAAKILPMPARQAEQLPEPQSQEPQQRLNNLLGLFGKDGA